MVYESEKGREKLAEKKKLITVEDVFLPRPKDFTEPDVLFKELTDKILRYHPSADIEIIKKAYAEAKKAHEGQVRKSGEPYIIHPLCVSLLLADLELDKETIVASLLHDVVEDTIMTKEEIGEMFNEDVETLVDGVTKLTNMANTIDKTESQAENLRKMFLAMAKDIRVILIKLADRLHNIRTLRYRSVEKRKRIARETLDIYAPIAQRLGIAKIKMELEDLCFWYLEQEVYEDLAKKIAATKKERETLVIKMVDEIDEIVQAANIRANVYAREKHYFSIYRKMMTQNKTLDQIYNWFAVMIIVDTSAECYAVLGKIHERYKPIPGRMKEFIAVPKPNMYQALHTVIMSKHGNPVEVQIRTMDMERTAAYGIAAHWKYKEGTSPADSVKGEARKSAWLAQILEWQKEMTDNREFMDSLKSNLDLFSDNITCFTPTGEVKHLVNGSSIVDFAYQIHTAIGNNMVSAKVNGKIVSVDYIIHNGDQVEIITSQNSLGPIKEWLKYAKGPQAKNKIAQWFREQTKEESIRVGQELLTKYCENKGIQLEQITDDMAINSVLKKYGFHGWDALLAALGRGSIKEGQIIDRLLESVNTIDQEKVQKQPDSCSHKCQVVIEGIDNYFIRFAKCCCPVPPDEITGYVSKGNKISIHRTDCTNMIQLSNEDRRNLVAVEWENDMEFMQNKGFRAEIRIELQTGILKINDILMIFAELGLTTEEVRAKANKDGAGIIYITFEVRGKEELEKLIKRLYEEKYITCIERTRG